jgi:osmotically-inducible protein OsmY
MMLIDYGTFDLLQYQVQGNTVVLSGAVRNADLRPDAEAAVKRIEGVEHVVNNIKVLSPSLFDDQIRLRVARAVFNAPGMLPYTMGANSPIHIIVEHGNVTLEGFVDTQFAKNVAGIYANQVAGPFSVTNNLRVGS